MRIDGMERADMDVRERTEQMEAEFLSPRASKSRDSTRLRAEEPCQFRTDYQRDRDRVIHSKAFRRLKQKTQVYIAPGDHYRMRLTHSLEVAQIARTIARGLRLNEDLTEAVALGHDVGHTPFGHAGEDALAELIGHFRHNEQSLRVVEYIERGGDGLNLTKEVKDGILNHTGNVLPATLEGRVVKISDRIAYLCHDFDDSMRSKMLKKEDLPRSVRQTLGYNPSDMITAMVSDMIVSSEERGDIVVSSAVDEAMRDFRSFMFERIYHSESLAEERRKATFIVEQLFHYFYRRPEKLPEDYLLRVERWGRQTTVADYIAGLTDVFAISLFKRLFVPPVRERL